MLLGSHTRIHYICISKERLESVMNIAFMVVYEISHMRKNSGVPLPRLDVGNMLGRWLIIAKRCKGVQNKQHPVGVILLTKILPYMWPAVAARIAERVEIVVSHMCFPSTTAGTT